MMLRQDSHFIYW